MLKSVLQCAEDLWPATNCRFTAGEHEALELVLGLRPLPVPAPALSQFNPQRLQSTAFT